MSEGASSSASAGSSQGNAGAGQSTGEGSQSLGTQGGEGGGENTSEGSGENTATEQAADPTGEKAVTKSFEKTGEGETEEAEPDDYKPVKDYIREMYKDEQFDDDEKVDRKAYRHIKDLEGYRERNKEANKKVTQLFDSHPELVGILQDMDKGASFREAIARNVDIGELEAVEGDPDFEAWTKNKTERETKATEKQKWMEGYENNRKESSEAFKKFVVENKWSQEQAKEFAEYADGMLKPFYDGKIDIGLLTMMNKARNADKERTDAAAAAEIKGKNEGIKAKAEKIPEGDGLPDLGKSGESRDKPKVPEGVAMISDLIDAANKRNNKF